MGKENELLSARNKLKLTQEEVAQKVNISRCYYTNLENKRKKPSIDVAIKLSRVLKSSVEKLFES